MNIAIDARFYGSGHTGLGRYTTNVMQYLPNHLQGQTLQVLLRDAEYDNFPSAKNIQKIHCEIPHYSLKEQLLLPKMLAAAGSQLLYTLHFNAPLFSSIPTIVTIHDLIKSHFTGRDTTTRSPWLYALKRSGYNLVIKHTVEHAQDIIVPSNTVKNNLLAAYPSLAPELIHIVSEAPDLAFRNPPKRGGEADILSRIPQNYLLFVGNAYPHKNLSLLLSAMDSFPGKQLVIVAKNTPFLKRLLAGCDRTRLHVLSQLSDQELVQVYQGADLLITPSLMEGYGLVGLESLMVGTPVVASNIPVYREVYGNLVTYFDPHSLSDLVRAIKSGLTKARPKPLHFPRTWDDVAKSIAEVIHARCARL